MRISSLTSGVLSGFLALISGIAMAGGCSPAPAANSLPPCCSTSTMQNGGRCMAPATQFQFTIAYFGFEKSDGTELRFGSPRLFDAARVSAGSSIGDYLSGVDLPAATYVALRPALSGQISLRANSRTADGRLCTGSITTTAHQPGGQAWPTCGVGQPDATTALCLSGGLLKIRDDRLGSFTIGNGGGLNLNFQFDVNNGVVCNFAPGNGPSNAIDLGVLSVNLSKS